MGQIDYRALGLKPQLSFDSLVVGPHNQIAVKACQEAAKAPGETYNPLFLYGSAGGGKSHLMQAVALEMLKTNPNLKVRYSSSERFMNEVISGIAEDNVMMVRDRYSSLDLWIMDDVQFLMESKSTQAEFYHIFNNLQEDNRQIILSADRPPNNLVELDKTIRSRLEGGLAVEVGIPDLNGRVDILKLKQSKFGISLNDEMLKYAAGVLKSNVRELEGFLKKINAYVTLSHQTLTLDLVRRVVRELLPEGQKDITPEETPQTPSQAKTVSHAPRHTTAKETREAQESTQLQSASGGGASAPSKQKGPEAPPSSPSTKPLEVVMPEGPQTPPKSPPPKPEGITIPSDAIVPPPAEPDASPSPPDKEKAPAKEITPPSDALVQETPPMPEPEEEEEGLPQGHKEVRVVFFYPKGSEDALNTVASKFQDVIKKHKLKFRLKRASSQPYEYEGKVNYSSFCDVCKANKVAVAIVVGPPPSAVISEHDFYDLLSVTLDVQGISLQLVNWTEINKDYRYLNLSLDIALVRSR